MSNMNIKPMTISFTNITKYVSFMSPLLITFFMIMISIFNNNILKGVIFSMGLVIITFINYILKNTLKETQSPLASPFCNILPSPFTVRGDNNVFVSPGLSSTIIGYTCSYLIFPMKINNQLNPSLITFLIVLLCINGVVEIQDKCASIGGVVLGAIVGILFGILYYTLISTSGHRNLAYFSETISNNSQCSKPSAQKFKCEVYKNGQKL